MCTYAEGELLNITNSLANSVTRHLELPEEPLLNGDKLVNSSSSNDSHCIPNGAIHHNTPVNGNSKSASPEPIFCLTACCKTHWHYRSSYGLELSHNKGNCVQFTKLVLMKININRRL